LLAARVDEVAGDYSLVRGRDRHRGLAGQDPGSCLDLGAEALDRIDELKPGPHSALRVVLVGGRRSPDGHDRVADELLDRSAVARNDLGRKVEVPTE